MSLWRLVALRAVFWLLGFLIILRLFWWQVVYGEKLKALAESQYQSESEILAPRGKILTSDGFPIVADQPAFLVYVNLKDINLEPTELVARLSPILNPEDPQLITRELKERLGRPGIIWVPLAHKVNREVKEAIEKLGIAGIGFEEEEKRFYPEGSVSAHLLGFVGQDASGQDKGYFGLEGFYERTLAGRSGFLRQEEDASGKPILIGSASKQEAVVGRDLVLYLDRGVQFMVERKLKEGIEKYGASSGSVILLDPQTGGILSMASFPNYDAANYAQEDKVLFPNPAVAQTFEPGSVLKVVVMAAALDEKAVALDDRCPCSGPKTIGEYTIKTWNDQYHPNSTMTDIIVHSDNVGMVFVGEKLGALKLAEYLGRFGFGSPTGIDLEDETTATLRPAEQWSPVDLAAISFGQGIAITPIQLVTAVGAIANGGKLLEPHLVAKIKSPGKEVVIKPKVIREVLNPLTAKVMTEMMINAVDAGEAKWAKPKGYRIAGKTGTAQIPIAGHYDKEKTIASFVGFAPASNAADPSDGSPVDNPRFVMLVTLREPTSSPWGSETAAPLWFGIARELFNYFGISPGE